jgi:hypothetical protein
MFLNFVIKSMDKLLSKFTKNHLLPNISFYLVIFIEIQVRYLNIFLFTNILDYI